MIDDRVCLFYVADRLQDIVDKESTAEEFLREIIYIIGGNARLHRSDWYSSNPDALSADHPSIKDNKSTKEV